MNSALRISYGHVSPIYQAGRYSLEMKEKRSRSIRCLTDRITTLGETRFSSEYSGVHRQTTNIYANFNSEEYHRENRITMKNGFPVKYKNHYASQIP